VNFNTHSQRAWARCWVLSARGQDLLLDSCLAPEDLNAFAQNPSASAQAQARMVEGKDLDYRVKPVHRATLRKYLRDNPGLEPSLAGKVKFKERYLKLLAGEHLALGLIEHGSVDDLSALAHASGLTPKVVDAFLAIDPGRIPTYPNACNAVPDDAQVRVWRNALEALLHDCRSRGLGSFETLVRRMPAAAFNERWHHYEPGLAVSWVKQRTDPEVLSVLAPGFTGTIGELVDVANDFES
jgi:hypothetical protein